MADCKPYVEFAPGDLITAEGMNEMQVMVCEDIHSKVQAGVDSIKEVETAENANRLGGQTPEELCKEWLEKALQAIPKRTGYLKVFKRLKNRVVATIEHNLKTCPLVDVYQLLPFSVVCAVDDDKEAATVLFYLYHSSERKLKDEAGNTVEIEENDLPAQFKIPLAEILDMFEVPYTDDSSLGDLETELWKAMFAEPNDEFDMDDYCHSPWFERCCREERTVGSLKKKGDWDDLWLKMLPRKSINLPSSSQLFGESNPSPLDLNVAHFNLNVVGLMFDQGEPRDGQDIPVLEEQKLMVLLKV